MSVPRPATAHRISFVSLELEYGLHGGTFAFPNRSAPIVVAGPNGSGKTTMIEALVRTLYGFNRHRGEERALHDARRPWQAAGYRAKLTLRIGEECFSVERDFDTHRVRVQREPGGHEVFCGEANPGAGEGGGIARYREWLSGTLGFTRLQPYLSTAYIRQGDLRETAVTDELLRIAAGGHASIEPAREAVRTAYYECTIEPISPGDRTRRREGKCEHLTKSIAHLEAELARALSAVEARRPLVEERRTLREQLREGKREISLLEAALGPLADRRALTAEVREARSRVEALERLADELRRAEAALETRETEWRVAAGRAPYPDDFAERLAAVGELWRDLERVQRELAAASTDPAIAREGRAAALRSGAVIGGGSALFIAGIALLASGTSRLIGVAMLLSAGMLAGLGAAGRVRRRRRAEAATAQARHLSEREAGIRVRIAELLHGVPDADTLTPDTLPDRRDRFERQREARTGLDEARRQLEEVEERAHRELEPHDEGSLSERVSRAVVEARNELATRELSLQRSTAEALPLPAGVPAEATGLDAALEERRRVRGEVERQLAEVERRLRALGGGHSTAAALESRLQREREQLAEAKDDARAYRLAFALLEEGYEEFRMDDQQRLLASISAQLEVLTRGGLGPLESDAGLDAARLRAFDRILEVKSPPLSYGELHAVLLAVRLGAADFLSGLGIRAPILIDEPFLHLDAERAEQVWATLGEAGRERQVVVATGDRLMLEHLGIAPDIELPGHGG